MSDFALAESERAFFTVVSTKAKIPVDFNPVTLQVSVQAQSKSEGGEKVQSVSSSSAKLDLELVFDSTGSGEDVRKRTQPIERLLVPEGQKAPPKVVFEWGAFSFEGVVDSFKQTLDFFSRNGVPLRSSVALSIAQPNYVFDKLSSGRTAKVDGAVVLPSGSPAGLAALGGDAGAARLIAAANSLESLRAEVSNPIVVSGGVTISPALGFSAGGGFGLDASVSGGIGVGVSGGAGISSGFSAGVSGGFSAGVSGGAGVSGSGGFSAGASAGFSGGGSGSIGASFGGLQTSGSLSAGAGSDFDPDKIFSVMAPPAIPAGASFDVSGRASLTGGSAFRADVTGSIQFDDA